MAMPPPVSEVWSGKPRAARTPAVVAGARRLGGTLRLAACLPLHF